MRLRELLSDVSYVVELDLTTLRSRSVIRFGCSSPGASVFVDVGVDSIESAVLNGQHLSSGDRADARLLLPSLDEVNELDVTATVRLGGSKDRGLVAFDDDGGERFVYSYGRTDGVIRWAPCLLDVPARWDLRVVVPDGWTVLSHCRPVAGEDAGTWRFTPPYPLPDGPTFVAGPWARAESPEGVPLWARPSVAGALNRSPVGEIVAKALEHHARVLGIAYPYETKDCVFIPGYGSQAGCFGGAVLCHERVLHASLDREWLGYVRWVIAHETAHNWLGGLVGFSGAEDRWTAEGLATYLCHRANDSWDRFHVLEELEAHRDDQTGNSEAPSLIYAKPAAVVRHLESVIGTVAVETGLRSWLHEHAGGSSSGDRLVAAWSRAAGRDLLSWAQQWLHTPGINTLSYDRASSTIRQEGTPLREHHVTICAFDRRLTTPVRLSVVVAGDSTPIAEWLADRELVVLNVPASTYAKTRLDERSRNTLASLLGDLPDDVRAACWVAGVEMTRDGHMPATELGAWVDAFAEAEPNPEIRALLAAANG